VTGHESGGQRGRSSFDPEGRMPFSFGEGGRALRAVMNQPNDLAIAADGTWAW
jgi:hypothetical protein